MTNYHTNYKLKKNEFSRHQQQQYSQGNHDESFEESPIISQTAS